MTDGWKITLGVAGVAVLVLVIFQFVVGVTILQLLYDVVGSFFGVSSGI